MNPIVTIEMSTGEKIKIELYPEIAPNTVRNFVSLVKKGFYRWINIPQNNTRIYDTRRMPRRYRNG